MTAMTNLRSSVNDKKELWRVDVAKLPIKTSPARLPFSSSSRVLSITCLKRRLKKETCSLRAIVLRCATHSNSGPSRGTDVATSRLLLTMKTLATMNSSTSHTQASSSGVKQDSSDSSVRETKTRKAHTVPTDSSQMTMITIRVATSEMMTTTLDCFNFNRTTIGMIVVTVINRIINLGTIIWVRETTMMKLKQSCYGRIDYNV